MNTTKEIEPAIPSTITFDMPVTAEITKTIRSSGALAEAEVWMIDSADMAQLAANQRTDWAARIDQIKAMRADFLKPAKDIVDAATKWFNPPIEDLEAGRKNLGDKLLAWDRAEKARIAEAQRIADEQARKIRQEAEAKAAQERAKAEAEAKAAREKQEAALAAQRKAEAEGNAAAAKKAAADAAKAGEKAAAALENGAAAAQEVQAAAAAQAAAVVVPEATKIAGSSVKANWVACLKDGVTSEDALLLICNAIVSEGRSDLLAILKIDDSARGPLNKLAAALKGAMRVPGYVARDVPTLAGARK